MNENSINSMKTAVDSATPRGALGRIDQYELVRELGGGGFGTVYLAHDTESGTDVAVKGLPPLVQNSREEVENIRRNFALVSRLHHSHIATSLVLHPAKSVTYADRSAAEKLRVFEGDSMAVMAYAPGVTLSQWRKQFPDGRVPREQALEIIRQIASALDYAHSEKIIHRDIKPANVMVETRRAEGRAEGGSDGAKFVVQVLDFGLAAEVRSSMGRVSQQVTDRSGTRPYMAPEQWLGKKQGAATDQYALAVLAYELLTGEVPFASVFETGDPVVMMNVVESKAPELSSDLPQAMRKAFAQALAKEPGKRFENCQAFAAALEGSSGGVRSGVTLLLGFAILGALGFGGYRVWQKHAARPASEPARETTVAVPEKAAVVPTNVPSVSVASSVQVASPVAEPVRVVTNEVVRVVTNEVVKVETKEVVRVEPKPVVKVVTNEIVRIEPKPAVTIRKDDVVKVEPKPGVAIKRDVGESVKARPDVKVDAEAAAKAERAARERTRWAQLARGSVFEPNPPARPAGEIKTLVLPNGVKMTFVWCPPGRFLMGSPEDEPKRESGEVRHVVRLTRGFWLGETEVTRNQWKAIMGNSRFAWSQLLGSDGEFPIDNVSWLQCVEFCEKLGQAVGGAYRLPTEAEWEYACRAGTVTPFNFGSALNGDRARCAGATEPYGTSATGSNSYSGSERVRHYARNAWNLYDMHGNLFEWCSDYHADYSSEAAEDPKGPASGRTRVIRGGCWNYTPKMCRSAFRSRKEETAADEMTGFRVCADRLP